MRALLARHGLSIACSAAWRPARGTWRSTPMHSGPAPAGAAAAFSTTAAAAAGAGHGASTSGRPTLRGVVFDMDGTLTVPVIDFALMRRRVGVTQVQGTRRRCRARGAATRAGQPLGSSAHDLTLRSCALSPPPPWPARPLAATAAATPPPLPSPKGDILDVISSWPEAERARAYAAIAEIEEQALADMKVGGLGLAGGWGESMHGCRCGG
jgi:hypothetical protein